MQMHSQDPNYRRHPNGTEVPRKGSKSMALPSRLSDGVSHPVTVRRVKPQPRREGFPRELVSRNVPINPSWL